MSHVKGETGTQSWSDCALGREFLQQGMDSQPPGCLMAALGKYGGVIQAGYWKAKAGAARFLCYNCLFILCC